MPLSRFQSRLLLLLAADRSPESFIACATPLTRDGPRYSRDIDVFHDRETELQHAVEVDSALLIAGGLTIEWTKRFPMLCTALVSKDGDGTSLEWLVDRTRAPARA